MLELRLRKSDSKSFQDFVGDFFGRLYPEDFIRVRAHGNLGDGGMDGFRQSDGTLYQCYGAHNGHVQDIRPICEKIKQDFETARANTPQMRRWLFTHNLIDMPRPMVDAYLETKKIAESYGIDAGLCGFDTFRSLLPQLAEDDLEDLIGIAVYSNVDTERLPENVNMIVKRLMATMDSPDATVRDVTIPPREKLDYNDIPARWRANITMNLMHADIVTAIIGSDEKAPDTMPRFMKNRYIELKAQEFDAGVILGYLHQELAGYINEYDGRYEAATAIIAALFESCIIFEDKEQAPQAEALP
jgi:hypothetical protein